MRGLKTLENNKFLAFFEIVQNRAQEFDSVYFLSNGEGREIETSILSGEDLFGFLVPSTLSEEFENLWIKDDISEEWNKYCFFAEWDKQSETILINFNQY